MDKFCLEDSRKLLNNRDVDIRLALEELNGITTIEQTAIFKAAVIMLIYNEVEGVYTSILTELFDYINSNNLKISTVPEELQEIFLQVHIKEIGTDTSKLHSFYNKPESNLTNFKFKRIENHLKLFSGNLDALKIRKISNRLGVRINKSKIGSALYTVKNYRNQLAHGEIGYSEACRTIFPSDLTKYVDDAKEFLLIVIEAYEQFVTNNLSKIEQITNIESMNETSQQNIDT